MSKKVYELVTNRIIEQLEKGVVPWRRPWVNSHAVNWLTQRPYRGINAILLDGGEYATFKQIKDAGGRVKKGAKSEIVVFWKLREIEEKDTEETRKIPLLRYYRVFNIDQCEGIESKRENQTFDHDPILEAEKVLKNFMDAPELRFAPGKAFYSPSLDYVSMPPIKDFPNPNEYYSTLFHEMVHSTGHKSRLDRSEVTGTITFGSESYSKEELVAELGAAMLCGVAKIDRHTIENSASYLQGWLRKLKDDHKLIVQAAARAQRAADYILGEITESEGAA